MERATAAEGRYLALIARLPCVVCARLGQPSPTVQIHHIAEGSGLRSNYAVAPLCEEHHDPNRAGSGFHGMGTERFCKLFRVPGETEYGLLVWTAEQLEKLLRSERCEIPKDAARWRWWRRWYMDDDDDCEKINDLVLGAGEASLDAAVDEAIKVAA